MQPLARRTGQIPCGLTGQPGEGDRRVSRTGQLQPCTVTVNVHALIGEERVLQDRQVVGVDRASIERRNRCSVQRLAERVGRGEIGVRHVCRSLIACSSPLLVAAAGATLGWDRLSTRQWAGIALGVVGVAVTLVDRLGRPPTVAALGWTLFGLAGLTAGTILQGRLRTTAGPAALAATEIAAAALVMAAWAPLAGSLIIPDTARASGSFLWIAIVPGIAGPLLFFALIRQRGATRASSLLFVVPAVTALAAWPILGAPIGTTTLCGLAIAGTGLWLAGARRAATSVTAPPTTREPVST